MRVLVACEESQEVCKSFRALGHEAYSCDVEWREIPGFPNYEASSAGEIRSKERGWGESTFSCKRVWSF